VPWFDTNRRCDGGTVESSSTILTRICGLAGRTTILTRMDGASVSGILYAKYNTTTTTTTTIVRWCLYATGHLVSSKKDWIRPCVYFTCTPQKSRQCRDESYPRDAHSSNTRLERGTQSRQLPNACSPFQRRKGGWWMIRGFGVWNRKRSTTMSCFPNNDETKLHQMLRGSPHR
jgi:hypothetical protein